MIRPSWETTYMDICETLAKRSTCIRVQTASVIVKDNIIVSVGYNGVGAGDEHCIDKWKDYDTSCDKFKQIHHEWSNHNELHGEMNAILFAGKNGISTKDATLYSIYSPCIHCAKAIYTSGIASVYYKIPYDRSVAGIEFLVEHGVSCVAIEK